MAAQFDRVVFWGEELSAEDVALAAAGGVPRAAGVVAQFDFDLDDPAECWYRRL